MDLPPQSPPGPVTQFLRELQAGDQNAFDRLFPLVYAELRRTADHLLRREQPGHTLQPTALVHEAYLRLVNRASLDWQSRAHFLAVAARAMRQILVDYARRRGAVKRGGGVIHARLGDEVAGVDAPLEDLMALDDALNRLGDIDARLRQVVEFRFFGGLTEEEIADILGITTRTAQRDWARARAWLYKELYQGDQ